MTHISNTTAGGYLKTKANKQQKTEIINGKY